LLLRFNIGFAIDRCGICCRAIFLSNFSSSSSFFVVVVLLLVPPPDDFDDPPPDDLPEEELPLLLLPRIPDGPGTLSASPQVTPTYFSLACGGSAGGEVTTVVVVCANVPPGAVLAAQILSTFAAMMCRVR
jgi:hypothetical protein